MSVTRKLPGYHVASIPRGVVGDSSKIMEEINELLDAEKQGVRLMILQELSDIVGAVRCYLAKNFEGITLPDLIDMADVTQRAFQNGHRK